MSDPLGDRPADWPVGEDSELYEITDGNCAFWTHFGNNPGLGDDLVIKTGEVLAERRWRKTSFDSHIWSELRWDHRFVTDHGGGYKLDDHHRARYLRYVLSRKPEWAQYFELRRLRS